MLLLPVCAYQNAKKHCHCNRKNHSRVLWIVTFPSKPTSHFHTSSTPYLLYKTQEKLLLEYSSKKYPHGSLLRELKFTTWYSAVWMLQWTVSIDHYSFFSFHSRWPLPSREGYLYMYLFQKFSLKLLTHLPQMSSYGKQISSPNTFSPRPTVSKASFSFPPFFKMTLRYNVYLQEEGNS